MSIWSGLDVHSPIEFTHLLLNLSCLGCTPSEPYSLENIRDRLYYMARAEMQLKFRLFGAQLDSPGLHPTERIREFHLWVCHL